MAKRGKARRGSIGKCNSALLYVVVCLDAVYFIHTKENPSQRDGQTSSTVKLRNFEKAPKFGNVSQFSWRYLLQSKMLEDFFKFLWPSQNIVTLLLKLVKKKQNFLFLNIYWDFVCMYAGFGHMKISSNILFKFRSMHVFQMIAI